MAKKLYYKIGEACKKLDIQPYVLRYWETEFPCLQPRQEQVRTAGLQRARSRRSSVASKSSSTKRASRSPEPRRSSKVSSSQASPSLVPRPRLESLPPKKSLRQASRDQEARARADDRPRHGQGSCAHSQGSREGSRRAEASWTSRLRSKKR